MTPDEAKAIIHQFPHVEEAFGQGSLGFKVNGKGLCRIGARTGPDDLMLSDIGPDEAEMLIAADPTTFHTTPHFTDARCLLARLGSLQPDVLRSMIERRWRKIALMAWVKAYDAG